MADTMDTLVCIGGPANGRRMRLPPGDRWVRVAERRPLRFPSDYVAPQQAEAWFCLYERRQWVTGTVKRWVLVPQDQTAEQTFDLLLEGYKPPSVTTPHQ